MKTNLLRKTNAKMFFSNEKFTTGNHTVTNVQINASVIIFTNP